MKKATEKRISAKFYAVLSAICLAAALLVLSLSVAVTHAKYVTVIEGGTVDYDTQLPFEVKSQQDLVNAIKSGYGSVRIKANLDSPIIMTGDSLELVNDLVIDLNGNEIERNNRESLLNVPAGKSFTIVDKAGGGGLYNPIGTVLSVTGGDLNVYGGKFESGPRPEEYFTTLKGKSEYAAGNLKNLIDVGDTYNLGKNGSIDTTKPVKRARLAVRNYGVEGTRYMGNIYFDVPYTYTVEETSKEIKRDTYCYVMPEGDTGENFAAFDTSEADFSYVYFIDSNGYPVDLSKATDTTKLKRVMIFGYENDIAYSYKNTRSEAPNYAAVKMFSGKLNVNVDAGTNTGDGVRKAGSFYQYFGTWHTSCIYMEGGEMDVSTTGEIATVNPNSLPKLVAGETRENSAKYGESAGILSITKTDVEGNPLGTGGTLNITRLASATSYNGSVISLSGGDVTLYDTNITKNATLSHGDDPFAVADEGGEFPADRQYRDAAIFLNGGTLTLKGKDDRAKAKSVNIVVNKDINNKAARAAGSTNVQTYPDSELGEALNAEKTKYRLFQTTFGILSRGKSKLKASSFDAQNLAVTMHGAYSYGIFGTRGKVKITDGSITLDSDSHTYGIYAVNKTDLKDANGNPRAVNVELVGTDIELGNVSGTNSTYEGSRTPVEDMWLKKDGTLLESAYETGAMRAASCGVYLDSSEKAGGRVTLDNSMIHSQELGVSVNKGTLTFRNGGGISAYNASAICLAGGNITFENNSTTDAPSNYNINCYINRLGTGPASGCSATSDEADAAGSHRYEIYLPYQRTERDASGNRVTYANENGIRVVGGSLDCEGKLTVKFRGLYNDYKDYVLWTKHSSSGEYTNYDKVKIKSFAVACIDRETAKDEASVPANIDIKYADITSSVGGGVKVQGGTITLGDPSRTADAYKSDINVHTTGFVHLNVAGYAHSGSLGTTWQFFPNLSGGHAVIARGGNITVYNGTYTADNSNGVAASDEGGEAITINIYNGTFEGKMYDHGGRGDQSSSSTSDHYWDTTPPWGGADVSLQRVQALGPSTYYGLKVLGAAHVNIKGGYFDGRNGGAFVRGSADSADKRAIVKIERGVFDGGEYKDKNDNVSKSDCFNASDYSTVYFGTLSKSELSSMTDAQKQNLIKLNGFNTTISVDSLRSDLYAHNKVYLFYGSYTLRTDKAPFGIGYIASGLNNADLFVYGYGTNIRNQDGVTWGTENNTYVASGRIQYSKPTINNVAQPRPTTTRYGVGSDEIYYAEDKDGKPKAEDKDGKLSDFAEPTGDI